MQKNYPLKQKKLLVQKKLISFLKIGPKTYFQWMDNIEPWCISRQLWWGHQIPAWYGPDKEDIRCN